MDSGYREMARRAEVLAREVAREVVAAGVDGHCGEAVLKLARAVEALASAVFDMEYELPLLAG